MPKSDNRYSKYLKTSSTKNSKADKLLLNRLVSKVIRPFRPLIKTKVGKSLKSFFSNKEILKRIGLTILLIAIFRALASIPLPGIDMKVYKDYFGSASASEANYLLLVFTGGQLDSPSIVGLGLAAYINASIILQLLTPVIPKLTELSKEGERGQQVINQMTKYLTVILGFFYSIAYLLLISRRDLTNPNNTTGAGEGVFLIPHGDGSQWPTITKVIFMALILTAGSMLLVWISDLITEKGIGNGSSVVISVGILAALPALIKQDFSLLDLRTIGNQVIEGTFSALTDPIFLALLSIIVGAILLVITIVYIGESAREVEVQYARRVRGEDAGQKSSLPIKLTMTGVLPIIFASAFLSVPQLLIPFLKDLVDTSSWFYNAMLDIEKSFLFASADNVVNINDLYYGILDFAMIVLFGMFYSFIVMKPNETAENLQKSGAFIPGIRPGKSTENYISNVLLRIGFAGSIFLGAIALVPLVGRNLIVNFADISPVILSGIGGTSILIIVSVCMDTLRQYNSLRVSRSYEQYIR